MGAGAAAWSDGFFITPRILHRFPSSLLFSSYLYSYIAVVAVHGQPGYGGGPEPTDPAPCPR